MLVVLIRPESATGAYAEMTLPHVGHIIHADGTAYRVTSVEYLLGPYHDAVAERLARQYATDPAAALSHKSSMKFMEIGAPRVYLSPLMPQPQTRPTE